MWRPSRRVNRAKQVIRKDRAWHMGRQPPHRANMPQVGFWLVRVIKVIATDLADGDSPPRRGTATRSPTFISERNRSQ